MSTVTVSGIVYDPAEVAIANAQVVVTPVWAEIVGLVTGAIAPVARQYSTDGTGSVTMDLVPGTYRMTVTYGGKIFSATLSIPSGYASLALADVIAPASVADAVAASEAVASLRTFQGVYYGAAASDPAQDPNGDPPEAGDLYWNTTGNALMAYDGAAWAPLPTGAANDARYVRKDVTTQEDMQGALNAGTGADVGDAALRAGAGRGADGAARLDLIAASAEADYSARLLRGAGANGATELLHKGTGRLDIKATDAATIGLWTAGNERLRVDGAGLVRAFGDLTIDGTLSAPQHVQDQATWDAGTSETESLISPAKLAATVAAKAGPAWTELALIKITTATTWITVTGLPSSTWEIEIFSPFYKNPNSSAQAVVVQLLDGGVPITTGYDGRTGAGVETEGMGLGKCNSYKRLAFSARLWKLDDGDWNCVSYGIDTSNSERNGSGYYDTAGAGLPGFDGFRIGMLPGGGGVDTNGAEIKVRYRA